MNNEETVPIEVQDPSVDRAREPWQADTGLHMSFGLRRSPIYARSPEPEDGQRDRPHSNANGTPTLGPQRVKVPDLSPAVPPSQSFGKRAWTAVAQWEGVVETVEGNAFRTVLTPLIEGRPDFKKKEVVSFDFEELAYDSDRELIQPGVIVYWTVGRRKDEAGTMSNQSLVRVKREAPLTEARKVEAAAEAAAILAEVEEPG